MKWIIEGEKTFVDAREAGDYIMENCDDRYFDDMLDECNPAVIVCGFEYYPSRVWEVVDPIAYRCARADWADFEAGEVAYWLERMSEEEEEDFFGFSVECVGSEEREGSDA